MLIMLTSDIFKVFDGDFESMGWW
jgi:hypothetical protein